MGSLFEIETQLTIITELELIKSNEIQQLMDLILVEGKMINALITKIKKAKS